MILDAALVALCGEEAERRREGLGSHSGSELWVKVGGRKEGREGNGALRGSREG